MQALVIAAPGQARIEDVPEPEMKPGEALLKVRRVGLCGSDLNSFRGRNPLVTFPRVPGHEIAATIVALSADSSALTPGMDVTMSPYSHCGRCPACLNGRHNACQANQTLGVQRDGALTEYITVPIEKLYAAHLNLQELGLVEPLTVGCHAAARGRVAAGEAVAVYGCGGVGLGAIAAAAARGARVIAIDVDDAKLDLARAAGAAHTVNSRSQAVAAVLAQWTDGAGPSVVIEAVGSAETFRAAVEQVAFTGRVVYIGYAKEPVAYETKLFVQKELDILGSRNALPEDFRAVVQLLEQHRFPVARVASTLVRLEQAPQVLQDWSAHPERFSKITVSLD